MNVRTSLIHLLVFTLVFASCSADDPMSENENPQTGNPDEENPEEETSVIRVENTSELLSALNNVRSGDSIVVKEGTYELNTKIRIIRPGTEEKKISLTADDDGDRPVLDFSAMAESSSNQGIILNADYWQIKGFEIYGAGDNGMKIEGSNNLVEFCSFYECRDTGLQIDSGAANNIILNCDSYHNADSSIENADGFACKLTAGTGNKFIGCRAWENLDDGYDGYLRDNDNITTIYENCWAIRNGYLKDGTESGGDSNGFKTGGSDDKTLKHHAEFYNCVAVGNPADGFDHNSNRGDVLIYNCTAYNNGTNYGFGSTNQVGKLVVKNSVALGAAGSFQADEKDISHNSWMDGLSATEDDFQSLEVDQLMAPRKADGSLPDITFMHLVEGSELIDAGVDVSLPYNGEAPDLGAFEYGN